MLLTLPLGSLDRGTKHAARAETLTARLLTVEDDRDSLFGVRYRGFRDAGYEVPGVDGQYADSYDRLSTTLLVGVYLGRQPVGTMRLCFWTPGAMGAALPCEAVYQVVPKIKQRAAGPVVELSRMAVEPSVGGPQRRMAVYAQLVRMGLIVCFATDVAITLVATHEKWRTFYRRIFGFGVVDGPEPYPPGDEPIILLERDFRAANKRLALRNPFFRIAQPDVERVRLALQPWQRHVGV